MKTVQYFSDEYLANCKNMSMESIAKFLDDFRRMHSHKKTKSKLISIKIPEDLLATFKAKAELEGIPYQSKIKLLMKKELGLK